MDNFGISDNNWQRAIKIVARSIDLSGSASKRQSGEDG